jgi:hypothetical protein
LREINGRLRGGGPESRPNNLVGAPALDALSVARVANQLEIHCQSS